ncbi:MAG: hypothetical protein MMC33_001117 [Icmadophila ericetorum]|nr:hypothetical protein [Icmadophila ericetorum]
MSFRLPLNTYSWSDAFAIKNHVGSLTTSNISYIRRVAKRFAKEKIANLVHLKRKRKSKKMPLTILSLPRELRDEIYRHALTQKEPFAAVSQGMKCNGCGLCQLRTWSSVPVQLLRTCKQVALEATPYLYKSQVFSIGDSPFPLQIACEANSPSLNAHILPQFDHRYVHLVQHLDAKFHLGQYIGAAPFPTDTPTADYIQSNYLDVRGICKWYQTTLEQVCEGQPRKFSNLKTLTISLYEHGSQRYNFRKCAELFVLKIFLNQETEKISEIPEFVITDEHLEIEIYNQKKWALLKKRGLRAPIDSYLLEENEDPERHMFLPLLKLENVTKVEVTQNWSEKKEKLEGDNVVTIEEAEKHTWTFPSVDWFINFAGPHLVSFHRKGSNPKKTESSTTLSLQSPIIV